MIEPIILVHGGAGDIAEERVEEALKGVKTAAKAGHQVLAEGGSVLDAVQKAVMVLEDNPSFNAGTGSVLNIDGKIEMEALIIEGTNLKMGAITSLNNVKNPIAIARLVMEKTPHGFLGGDGAKLFVKNQKIPLIATESLITERARNALAKFKENKLNNENLFGTVGAVGVDSSGHVASATSTGGMTGKMVGRIGDTPLIGSGGYADDEIGAVSTTGHGDTIMRVCLAKTILSHVQSGLDPGTASQKACSDMTSRLGEFAGAITVSKDGRCGVGFSSKRMSWAYVKGNTLVYGITQGQQFEEIIC